MSSRQHSCITLGVIHVRVIFFFYFVSTPSLDFSLFFLSLGEDCDVLFAEAVVSEVQSSACGDVTVFVLSPHVISLRKDMSECTIRIFISHRHVVAIACSRFSSHLPLTAGFGKHTELQGIASSSVKFFFSFALF